MENDSSPPEVGRIRSRLFGLFTASFWDTADIGGEGETRSEVSAGTLAIDGGL